LDLGLPKINGFEAARRIREQSRGQGPVIVALTGWAQDTDRQRSRAAGFNAHIAKPVDAQVLANLLVEFPAVGSIR
jgi:CheY-like chemotaxis protein